jgi:regulator of sigma E protease
MTVDLIFRIIVTIFCLGFVVMIHEWGHFLVARYLGVRVERFTIGFGKELIGWTRGDTRYSICILPLGGMVKMAGDSPEEDATQPDEFFAKPWWARAVIALAGPLMNYALAFILFATVAFGWGSFKPSAEPIIGDMMPGLPAAQAKMVTGDRVKAINGVEVKTWEQMAGIIHQNPEKALKVQVERVSIEGGKAQTVNVTLTPQREPSRGIGLIGVVPKVEKIQLGFKDSLKMGVRDVKVWTVQPLTYISQKIRSMEGPKELSGPIGIAHMVTKASKEGVSYVIYLIAIISTGLGLFNLFPIPILDGGHILLYTIEGIIRRPLSRRTLQVVNMLGLSLILTIFLYASYQDILRWRTGLFR